MIDHDRIFKELIRTFFMEFVELFLPEVHADLDQSSIEFLDKEVFTDVTSGEKHEADLIVKARFRGQESFFLFHIEAQADDRKKPPFPKRMFTYFARLHEGHDLPVYPVVIFSYDSPLRPEPETYRVEFPGFTVLEFNFRVIQLNRLNWRDFLNHPNPLASALMAKMRMTRKERQQAKLECLRLILTFKLNPAKMQMLTGFVDTYLRLGDDEEELVRAKLADLVPKETFMEWISPWQRWGMMDGLKEGRKEGRMEEAITILMRQMKRRFGALGDDIEIRLRTLPLTEIEDLVETSVEFKQADDLTQWLSEHIENAGNQPDTELQTS